MTSAYQMVIPGPLVQSQLLRHNTELQFLQTPQRNNSWRPLYKKQIYIQNIIISKSIYMYSCFIKISKLFLGCMEQVRTTLCFDIFPKDQNFQVYHKLQEVFNLCFDVKNCILQKHSCEFLQTFNRLKHNIWTILYSRHSTLAQHTVCRALVVFAI